MNALSTETQLTLKTIDKSSRVLVGDCREIMRDLPAECVDAIVTDPPYELNFMGKKWDGTGVAYDVSMWTECLRVLKPGGHLLAFGGTRTYHRMTCAIEDAGFEVRDSLHWIYGSGFPKSRNVEKAGAGEAWQGWGTALKPSHEPIVVARKPLAGTVAENVSEYGTGAINIRATRVAFKDGEVNLDLKQRQQTSNGVIDFGASSLIGKEIATYKPGGRWPPNVLLSHTPDCGDECTEGCAVAQMDGQSGGASRFFPVFRYQAKASRADRDAGLRDAGVGALRDAGRGRQGFNVHPTVKPTELMRWLVRLVTPLGGLVFDPFTGSGSTGVACVRDGFEFIGCEMSDEYASIARARIEHG